MQFALRAAALASHGLAVENAERAQFYLTALRCVRQRFFRTVYRAFDRATATTQLTTLPSVQCSVRCFDLCAIPGTILRVRYLVAHAVERLVPTPEQRAKPLARPRRQRPHRCGAARAGAAAASGSRSCSLSRFSHVLARRALDQAQDLAARAARSWAWSKALRASTCEKRDRLQLLDPEAAAAPARAAPQRCGRWRRGRARGLARCSGVGTRRSTACATRYRTRSIVPGIAQRSKHRTEHCTLGNVVNCVVAVARSKARYTVRKKRCRTQRRAVK